MMFDDPIIFLEDISEYYAQSRNNAISKEKAKELLEIYIKFLKHKTKNNQILSLDIPRIGVLYKTRNKIMLDGEAKEDKGFHNFVHELAFSKMGKKVWYSKSSLDINYPKIPIEEVEKIQNESV